MKKVLSAVPIVRVTDLEASLDYYCRVLGFTHGGIYQHDPNDTGGYVSVSRDGAGLHLSSYDGRAGIPVYFFVEGVDALHDEWAQAGAEILYDPANEKQEPGDQPWGIREIYVRDPDGNVLRFGERLPNG